MKTRNGFVSNSSTTSFICDICGETYTGWDACPQDDTYDCSLCENEHIICNSHLTSEVEYTRGDFGDKVISAKDCPICNFTTYAEREMVIYLEKTRGIKKEEVFDKVKAINKRRKKLHNAEYVTYVCEKFSLTDEILLKEIKDKFNDYDAYKQFIH